MRATYSLLITSIFLSTINANPVSSNANSGQSAPYSALQAVTTPGTLRRRGQCVSSNANTCESDDSTPGHGIYFEPDTCPPDRLAQIITAIDGMGDLARVARFSLVLPYSSHPNNPAPYFFGQGFRHNDVNTMYQRIISYAEDNVVEPAPILITCQDLAGLCHNPNEDHYRIKAYTDLRRRSHPRIILCETFFASPSSIEPCGDLVRELAQGGLDRHTKEGILLHEFTHVLSDGLVHDVAYGVANCHELAISVTSAYKARFNADNYMLLAYWALAIGMGLGPNRQCWHYFPPMAQWQGLDPGGDPNHSGTSSSVSTPR